MAGAIRCSSSEITPFVVRVAAIVGSLRKASFNQGPCSQILKDIPSLEIEHIKIDQLPFVNTDLEVGGGFPEAVKRVSCSSASSR
ncbi:hypothetical protein GOP47_0015512 [Adiantum capillus-veneris]|uniref:NAD(P)H dehydrogenase (quinone) n=1 Tax=Adiantum capillus-veneris TaxID=13818 RepID=A0A9D4UKR4_ADICA|nr:hypothetical protein GOP47_0015512 [Adiantum capillus-veneris]